jgi:hypothetical protein
MLEADDLNAALAQEAIFRDERLTQSWDSKRALGKMVSRLLALSVPIAWDTYLLYPSGARWEGESIPAPDFWMHQLDERPDLLLKPDRLMAEVQRAMDATQVK